MESMVVALGWLLELIWKVFSNLNGRVISGLFIYLFISFWAKSLHVVLKRTTQRGRDQVVVSIRHPTNPRDFLGVE